MERISIFFQTVVIVGLSFLCYLLNQLHTDMKKLESLSEKRELKYGKIRENQGLIFSILLIVVTVVFLIVAFVALRSEG